MKKGKRYQEAEKLVDKTKLYSAKDALDLFQKESGSIFGREISLDNTMIEREISFSEFLVNDGETALEKYGDVLKKIVELTSK